MLNNLIFTKYANKQRTQVHTGVYNATHTHYAPQYNVRTKDNTHICLAVAILAIAKRYNLQVDKCLLAQYTNWDNTSVRTQFL